MRDPYEVLGLARNATKEQVKQRHRELAKKYHPDRYQGNPLSDLAEEKLSEINEAYDTIMKGLNSSSSYENTKDYSGESGANNPIFDQIRMALDRNDLNTASNLLNSVADKSAQWYFLSGMLSYKRGWMDDAVSKIQIAVSLNPNNKEYQNVLNQLVGLDGYFNNASRRGYNSSQDDCCRAMMCYCCFDSMCDCI